MQIEYSIRFRADGVTVAQNIQPDGSVPMSSEWATQNVTQGTVASGFALPGQPSMLALPAGDFGDGSDVGGGEVGLAAGDGDKLWPGGGDGDKLWPGGGKSGIAPLVVISSPIVITYVGGANTGQSAR